jgi:hypothetical protein
LRWHVTDFWGPASNFGIPIAAVMDTQKDPEMYVAAPYSISGDFSIFPSTNLPTATMTTAGHSPGVRIVEKALETGKTDVVSYSISGRFTAALTVYSATFMRYALAVTPKNYLLFACHFINFNAQLTQGYRWYKYWQYVLSLPLWISCGCEAVKKPA